MSVGVRTLGTCDLVGCAHGAEFDVDHPNRGVLRVCSYHARTIAESLGGVEVTL
jgi:hypothetical protein